jgi:hypothetical protein
MIECISASDLSRDAGGFGEQSPGDRARIDHAVSGESQHQRTPSSNHPEPFPPMSGLWHPYRRKWATERKHLSITDVAEAGGWKDTVTLLTCYARPDNETLLA